MKLHIVLIAIICAVVAHGDDGSWLDSYIREEACPGMDKTSTEYESCVATMCTKYLNMARQRASNPKPAVKEGNAAMVKNAIDWSDHQGKVNKMYHQDLQSGVYPDGQCSVSAENVAMPGRPSNPAASCIKMWIRSSGHYDNMMGNYKYSACGIAVGQSGSYYCTQTFSNNCEGGAVQPIVTNPPAEQTVPPTAPPRPIITAAPTAPPVEPIVIVTAAPTAPPVEPIVIATSAPTVPPLEPIVVITAPPTSPPKPVVTSEPLITTAPSAVEPKYSYARVFKDGKRMTYYKVCNRFSKTGCKYCSWFSKNGRKCLSDEETITLDKLLSKFFY